MNLREAYEATSAAYVAGASVIARGLVERVAAAASSPELVHAVDFARKAVHVADGQRREALARLHRLVGIADEPDETTFDRWLRATRAAIDARATGESARAAELGTVVGELYLGTWAGRLLIYLRTADPANAETTRQAEAIDRRIAELRAQLAVVRAYPEAHGAGATLAQLAALLAHTHAVAAATTLDAYKAYFEWARQIWNLVEPIGAMLAPVDPKLADAFAAILANPYDDAPRLRYAELAGGDHAEFIKNGIGIRDMHRNAAEARYIAPIQSKQVAIVKRHPEWGLDVLPLVDSLDFSRGFVERVTLPAAQFDARAPQIFAKAPVTHAKLTDAHGKLGVLAKSVHLEHLRSLDLSLNNLDDADAAALASSPHLKNLRWLELKQNRIGAAGLDALAAATRSHFPNLRYLGILINQVQDPTEQALEDENGRVDYVERNEGIALEKKHGPLPWIHFQTRIPPDPDAAM